MSELCISCEIPAISVFSLEIYLTAIKNPNNLFLNVYRYQIKKKNKYKKETFFFAYNRNEKLLL